MKVTYTDQSIFPNSVKSANSCAIAAAHTQPPEPVASVTVVHNGAILTVSWDTPARTSTTR